MPDPRFIGLVHSLRSSAEAALGDLASPMVTRLARDGALARTTATRSLDLLDLLFEKTRGNLDATEREALVRAREAVRARLAATAGTEGDAATADEVDADGARTVN
ncbi:MAG: DUF1844 domain-containing protein [Trueperaceae bacterium]